MAMAMAKMGSTGLAPHWSGPAGDIPLTDHPDASRLAGADRAHVRLIL
jgi:hypothetical protein